MISEIYLLIELFITTAVRISYPTTNNVTLVSLCKFSSIPKRDIISFGKYENIKEIS
jgi:hypothetical protein